MLGASRTDLGRGVAYLLNQKRSGSSVRAFFSNWPMDAFDSLSLIYASLHFRPLSEQGSW